MAQKSPDGEKKDAKPLIHTDIKDLHIGRKFRSIGEIRVTDWELSDVIPAFRELAKREVNVPELLRKTANYQVFELDFPKNKRAKSIARKPDFEKVYQALKQADAFIEYLTRELVGKKERVDIRHLEHRPHHHLIVVILSEKGASAMIGRGGYTAAAIRSIVEDAGERVGVVFELKVVAKTDKKPSDKVSPYQEGSRHQQFEYVDEGRKDPSRKRKRRKSR